MGKPPLEFTPFHEPIEKKIARWWAGTKRLVGTSAVGGVVAVLAPIPGPHTVVMLGGMVVGAAVAVVTRKKRVPIVKK
ncbi:MAG: hypothetical protein A2534_05175 [Candidatus Magasanikbacteria bacterium RIFOXYD2_FULL_39_9]|uniref:Uncharacterized protein n=1 Tax=Candidatus Magasanikbacteria bacterium RIFOXYD1_FULL_40_23 TaxID=1798705 RepID=A0A1F6P9J2_9BACT|nr:MAG: hypothetical protein A2563_04200 [Candidatus Magasanikbacteria bacterium RIFOXYD1_FULL_40_23]OGH93453.1 MAG: hypothetical protein A2534_05175 [Candidatus Magasanikbacteria bacterium RIFOXYD2_FULL_39_9]